MRPIILLALVAGASASWFSSKDSSTAVTPKYSSWSTPELKAWLVSHNIPVPADDNDDNAILASVQSNWDSASSWTQDQYDSAQKSFSTLRDSTFDTWDESALRQWLLEQGVVSPKSKKEELVLLAKHRYNDYLDASKTWGEWAASSGSDATNTVKSIAATATNGVEQALDDSKDYVYSTWDDNRLRSYLEEQGALKTKQQKSRDEMLKLMKQSYANTADPIYDAWSSTYLHSWLVSHNLLPESQANTAEKLEKSRDSLLQKMNIYYYSTTSKVWDAWSDSDLHNWLVANNVVKDEAKVSRDKMIKLVEDTYNTAATTMLGAWTDSQIRSWLVKNGYIDDRTATQKKRDELVQLVKDQYSSTSKTLTSAFSPHLAPYLSWPDTRLRAYLAERGVKEKELPSTREELLQRTRQLFSHPEAKPYSDESVLTKIREIVNDGVSQVEEKLVKVWEVLSGHGEEKWEEGKKEAKVTVESGRARVNNEL